MEPLRYQHGIMRAEKARHGFKIIKFCQGRSAHGRFYAFVSIEPGNLPYFEDQYKPGMHCDFKAFGDEILRGWGLAPPEDIVEHLKLKYNIEFGVDPEYLLHLSGLTLQAPENLKENAKEGDINPSSPFRQRRSTGFQHPEKPAEAGGS